MNPRDIELLYEIGTFRLIPRTWAQFLTPEFANDAEHTLRMMWIALLIAKREGADAAKVVQMALVHDISELRAGDVHYLSRMYTERHEAKAVTDTLQGTSLQELAALWEEYQQRQSVEAKIVKDADMLDVDLELQEQHAKGNALRDSWKEIRERVREKLFTQSAKEMWDAIKSSDPHGWHTHGRNRYTAGDWKR